MTTHRQPQSTAAPTQDEREAAITEQVLDSFAGAPSPRYRQIMASLVLHLHAFARDVRLTQTEWEQGIEFLTRAGHITTDTRQEFILLSDVLGLSMLTVGINDAASRGATESTVFGPFFVTNAPEISLGDDIARGAKGAPCHVSGTVRSTNGAALPGARIEVWEADEDGFYDVQYDDDRSAGRAWMRSGDDGGYRFWSVLPAPYPIPDDGPVGDLLRAAARGPMRPAHLHLKVDAPGHRTLITHIFLAGDDHLDHDAVFGVKDSLVVDVCDHGPGQAQDGTELDRRWHSITFDITLAEDMSSRVADIDTEPSSAEPSPVRGASPPPTDGEHTPVTATPNAASRRPQTRFQSTRLGPGEDA